MIHQVVSEIWVFRMWSTILEHPVYLSQLRKQPFREFFLTWCRGGGNSDVARGDGQPRVSSFWSDTSLRYQLNKKENNDMFNIIENSWHTEMD